MSRFVEFTNLDDSKMSIDLDLIHGYIEQKDVHYKDDKGHIHNVPDHTLLLANKTEFRIKELYETVKIIIKEEMFNDNLGI